MILAGSILFAIIGKIVLNLRFQKEAQMEETVNKVDQTLESLRGEKSRWVYKLQEILAVNGTKVIASVLDKNKELISQYKKELSDLDSEYNSLYRRYKKKKDSEEEEERKKRRERERRNSYSSSSSYGGYSSSSSSSSYSSGSSWGGGGGGFSGGGSSGSW